MNALADALIRLAERRAAAVLAAAFAITLPLAIGYAQIPWTQDPEVITLEGSRELDFYREYVQRWGSDKWIVLAYEVEDAFAPDELERLRALGNAIWDIEGVERVESLDTASTVDTGPFGPYSRPVVPDEIRADPAIRRQALASPLIRDAAVSADGRVLAIGAQLSETDLDSSESEARILSELDAVLERPEFTELDVYRAGSPVFNREIQRLNQRDQARFVPLTVAVIALFLFALLRSAQLTGLALVLLALTVSWTLGIMSWLGIPMNLTTGLLPPLLMVVTIAETVHLLSAYLEERRAGRDRSAALAFTMREILPACAWTTITTAVGFASLLTVRIESVRTFASFAVLGVFVSLLLLATVLPAALALLRVPAPARASSPPLWLGGVRRAARRPGFALALLGVSLAIATSGLPRIEVSTHDGEFFAEDNPLNQAYRFIETHLRGVTPLEVEIRSEQPGRFRSPEAIRQLAALQHAMGAQPRTSAGTSLPDLLRAAQPGLDLEDDAAVERALFLLAAIGGDELDRYWRADAAVARISARTEAMSSAENEALLELLRSRAREIFPGGFDVRFTGLVPVFSQMEQYLVDGQVSSYGVAVAAVLAIFLWIFRSGWLVTVALIANTAPVAATLGLMGWLGIRLDVATIMVACIAEGIIVDDTVHLVHSFQRGLTLHAGDRGAALDHALEQTGRPIVITALILALGFSIPMLSDFQPTAHFGLLVCLAVLGALAAELLIMPCALLRIPLPAPLSGAERAQTHPAGSPQ